MNYWRTFLNDLLGFPLGLPQGFGLVSMRSNVVELGGLRQGGSECPLSFVQTREWVSKVGIMWMVLLSGSYHILRLSGAGLDTVVKDWSWNCTYVAQTGPCQCQAFHRVF